MGRSSRSWYAVWDLLSKEQRDLARAIGGYPPDWEPSHESPPRKPRGLEGLRELDRIMRLPPGIIDKWREALIECVEPEGE